MKRFEVGIAALVDVQLKRVEQKIKNTQNVMGWFADKKWHLIVGATILFALCTWMVSTIVNCSREKTKAVECNGMLNTGSITSLRTTDFTEDNARLCGKSEGTRTRKRVIRIVGTRFYPIYEFFTRLVKSDQLSTLNPRKSRTDFLNQSILESSITTFTSAVRSSFAVRYVLP